MSRDHRPRFARLRADLSPPGMRHPVFCNSDEWLAHRGTVGRVIVGDVHVLDAKMRPLPVGTPGTLWFKTASEFEYFNDAEKTAEARSADGKMSTVGDV